MKGLLLWAADLCQNPNKASLMICWDYTELSSMKLRAFSHQLMPFIFTGLPPGEEEEEARFILPILWKLEEIWQRLFHCDENLESGISFFTNFCLMGKSYISPFCRTLSLLQSICTTVIRDLLRTWFQEKQETLAGTSKLLGSSMRRAIWPLLAVSCKEKMASIEPFSSLYLIFLNYMRGW